MLITQNISLGLLRRLAANSAVCSRLNPLSDETQCLPGTPWQAAHVES